MTTKNSNKKFVIGLAVACLLPLSFYLIAKLLKKDHIIMPKYYRVEKVDTTIIDGQQKYDSTFHQVKELELINQLGDTVRMNGGLKNKIIIINFFFTNCPSVCPQLTRNMAMFQKAFRKDAKKEFRIADEIQLVSITVDPVRDTFHALRVYADKFGVDHDHWWFLTGDKHTIYDYARNELGLITGAGDGGADDFIHTEKIIVLDKQRFIRGYYDGLDTASLKKCADDVVLLTLEKKRKKK